LQHGDGRQQRQPTISLVTSGFEVIRSGCGLRPTREIGRYGGGFIVFTDSENRPHTPPLAGPPSNRGRCWMIDQLQCVPAKRIFGACGPSERWIYDGLGEGRCGTPTDLVPDLGRDHSMVRPNRHPDSIGPHSLEAVVKAKLTISVAPPWLGLCPQASNCPLLGVRELDGFAKVTRQRSRMGGSRCPNQLRLANG